MLLSDVQSFPAVIDFDGVKLIRRGELDFIAANDLLADVAVDIARGIPEDNGYSATVIVGLHRIPEFPRTGKLMIGVQTEHLVDASGNTMWNGLDRATIRKIVVHHDAVLDLSLLSAPSYGFLRKGRQAKVTFGPYVFPAVRVPRRSGGGKLLFAGGGSRRRNELLRKLAGEVDWPRRTFGQALHERTCESRAVLNLHQVDGVYTEAPRLLKAYLAGKPVISEPLSVPVIMGRHALGLEDLRDDATLDRIYASFDEEVARMYPFTAFLDHVLRQRA